MTLTTTHPLCPISGPPGAAFPSVDIRSIRAVPSPDVRRSDTDACPGALRLHTAADGPLARVRLPGGLLTGAQLRTVRGLAERWGDGHVELTSRANVQLRALTGAHPAALTEPLRAAGLLPSDTHEVVRNIAASPLHARAGVRALDRALCADARLAGLPGRFLFAFDAGHGDVYAGADVAAMPAGDRVAVLLAGTDPGLRVASADTVPAMLAAAHAFLDERAAQGRPAWRLAELADGPARVAARMTSARLPGATPAGAPCPPAGPLTLPPPRARAPVGLVEQADGRTAAGALVPLGRLGGAALRTLEQADLLVVTPWRGILVAGLAPDAARSWLRTLAAAGLSVTADSRWSGVTTCAGRPGCARSLADVRADADAATTAFVDGLPVHWVGCARGCGSPGGPHVRVEATGAGYEVTAPGFPGRATTTEVGALVATARRS